MDLHWHLLHMPPDPWHDTHAPVRRREARLWLMDVEREARRERLRRLVHRLGSTAVGRSLPRSSRAVVEQRDRVVVRRAAAADGPALRRLAALGERSLPQGPLLVAEADGEILVARSPATGEVVTDPARFSADLWSQLAAQARRLRTA
jgi:hypothetical protein